MLEGKKEVLAALETMERGLLARPVLDAAALDGEETVVFVVDMLSGFAREGPLSDQRIGKLAGPIAELLEDMPMASIVFMNDSHEDDSVEFGWYPRHCVKGTGEAEVVGELREFVSRSKTIEKNSTNGFVSAGFMEWFEERRKNMTNYIIVGDCTDICIKQFAITLKAWFTERNIDSRVIVPMNLVDTFNLEETGHNRDLMNTVSFYEMGLGGVEIVTLRY